MPFHFLNKEELISLRWRADHLQRELIIFIMAICFNQFDKTVLTVFVWEFK